MNGLKCERDLTPPQRRELARLRSEPASHVLGAIRRELDMDLSQLKKAEDSNQIFRLQGRVSAWESLLAQVESAWQGGHHV